MRATFANGKFKLVHPGKGARCHQCSRPLPSKHMSYLKRGTGEFSCPPCAWRLTKQKGAQSCSK